jgi:hypothetical protein
MTDGIGFVLLLVLAVLACLAELALLHWCFLLCEGSGMLVRAAKVPRRRVSNSGKS